MHDDNSAPRRAPGIALAVGDTAGHAYPALAAAEAFRERIPDARMLFLGTADSIAARILAREGEAITAVPGAPIRRAGRRGAARALVETMAAIRAARPLLADHRASYAIGFGGFASAGVLLAARTLGVRTAIHEANVEPGLANLWLRRLVHDTFQAHDGALAGARTVGLPVRREIAALATGTRTAPDRALRVLVMSGSRGAAFLAEAMPPVIAALEAHGVEVTLRQQPPDGFLEGMAEAYRWADVAVSRAGAGTIAELAIAGLPAVLVPLPDAAADHQAANAACWRDAGAGPAIRQEQWDTTFVAEWLRTLAINSSSWQLAAAAARSLARPDAAQRLVEHCVTMMNPW